MKAKTCLSINDWAKIFSELYGKADFERTPEQMWIAVMAHTSQIGESIRRFAFEDLLKSAAHTFCWLCSFVNKCNVLRDDVFSINETLPGIVSLKYPGACGHCQKTPCSCDPVRMDREADKSAAYKKLFGLRKNILASFEGYSIDQSKEVFYQIYGGMTHIQTLETIGFHFLEEVGEAAVCVRQLSQLRKITEENISEIDLDFLKQLSNMEGIVDNFSKYGKKSKEIDYASTEAGMLRARLVNAKMGLVIEIGDSFSWFCAILNKLDFIAHSIYNEPEKHKEILKPFEKALRDEYFDASGNAICPSCKSNPCKCAFFNVPTKK